MNTAEHIGAIIKDKVEELMAREDRGIRLHKDVLKTNLENVLKSLENDSPFCRFALQYEKML